MKPSLSKSVGWPCPARLALKRTLVQDFNFFSIMFYNIISTTYQKIGYQFFPLIFLDFPLVWSMWVTFSLDNGWFVLVKKSTHFSFGGKLKNDTFHMPFIYKFTNIFFSVATNPLNFNTEEIARKYTKQVLLLYLLSMCVVRTTIPNSKVIVV